MQKPGSPSLEGLEFETVKCGHESRGTLTHERLRWLDPDTTTNYRPVLSSERTPHISKTRSRLKIIKKKFTSYRWVPDTKTNWRTDRRPARNQRILLASVTRQRLVKTSRLRRLSAVVNCRVWELAIEL
jgi:hypothetical protein